MSSSSRSCDQSGCLHFPASHCTTSMMALFPEAITQHVNTYSMNLSINIPFFLLTSHLLSLTTAVIVPKAAVSFFFFFAFVLVWVFQANIRCSFQNLQQDRKIFKFFHWRINQMEKIKQVFGFIVRRRWPGESPGLAPKNMVNRCEWGFS